MNDNLSTTSQWLKQAERLLLTADIQSARLDALILLEDVIHYNRAHILAHPEQELTHEQCESLNKLLVRRASHEPLAYLRKKSEFYGREFIMSPDVLVPRPESEMIIQLLRGQIERHDFQSIIDVGTGSGALAITAAINAPQSQVIAIDIDKNCLKTATENAKKHSVNIACIQGNLLEAIDSKTIPSPIAILANLPYVPNNYQINEAASNEPKLALFGGDDGLDLYRTMFQQLQTFTSINIFVFTESLPFQHDALLNIAEAQKFTLIDNQDLIQVFYRKSSLRS